MALRTALPLLALILAAPPPPAGQDSPLKWPVPPPGPSREIVFPHILIGAWDLARELAAGGVPLDVRDAGAYARGHIPGAVPAWRQEEEGPGGIDGVRSLLAERGITYAQTVILYGDPGRDAVAHLFWLMRRAGCRDVRILEGGLTAWLAAGGALEHEPAKRAPSDFGRPAAEPLAVDADWVAASFGQAGVELLDVRDARGWDRWQTPPGFGAGHIPYSLPFDPRALLPASGGWPAPAELRRDLGTLGPRKGDPVHPDSIFVLYGDDARDPRTALGYLLLTLAGMDARIFQGGWREWTANGGRPVVRVVSAGEVAALLRREDPALHRSGPPRGVILLDLREERDFMTGHLPGASNLPFRFLSERFEKTVAGAWPGADRATTPLVLYCYGIDCVRSRKAGVHAARLGYRNVLWFRGGVREWLEAGLPLLETPAATAPAAPASPGGSTARP